MFVLFQDETDKMITAKNQLLELQANPATDSKDDQKIKIVLQNNL